MISILPRDKAKTTYNQQTIKKHNIISLLNLMRKNMPISRAELAKRTALSPTTVSILIDELIHNNWVREVGTGDSAERGRKPIMLELNPDRGVSATVEILGRGFICSLYNICLNKLGTTRVSKTGYTTEDIAKEIDALLENNDISRDNLLSVHTIFPGLFDKNTDELISSAVIAEEDMVERDCILKLRQMYPHAEVFLSNNASLIAYAEFLAQNNSAPIRLLSLNIDEGITGGVVTGEASSEIDLCIPLEIGHIIVDRNGPPCQCNNCGCLEALCSTPAVFKAINEATDMGLDYSCDFGSDKNLIAIARVAERYKDGNPALDAVMQDYLYTLSCALTTVINLFSVESIHIGGSITVLGDRFVQELSEMLNGRFTLLNDKGTVNIELFASDFERVRLAAVVMSHDEVFKNV